MFYNTEEWLLYVENLACILQHTNVKIIIIITIITITTTTTMIISL